MSFQQILSILWARKGILFLAFCSTMLAAVLVVTQFPPRYEAVASVLVDIGEPDPVTGQILPSPLVRSHLRTQSLLLQSERVVSEVVGASTFSATKSGRAPSGKARLRVTSCNGPSSNSLKM